MVQTRPRALVIRLAAAIVLAAPIAASPPDAPVSDPAIFLTVDCLLPAQVRKMGRMLTYLGQRRAIRTSAADCEIRGGEYVAADRADYRTAFAVWLPAAKTGDARAQTYVGEIFERGLGRPVDYAAAAEWYERAVAQGYAPAKINLAHLLSEGLGAPADRSRADALLLEASRLDARLPVAVVADASQVSALKADRDALLKKLQDGQAEIDRLTKARATDRQALQQQRALAAQRQGDAEGLRSLQARLDAAERALSVRTAERDGAVAATRRTEAAAALRTQAAAARVADLQRAVGAAAARLARMRSSSDDGHVAAAALARQTADLAQAQGALASARDAAARDRAALIRKTQSLEAALATAAQARDRLNGEADTARSQIAAQQARLTAQEARLAESDRRLAALQAQMMPAGNDPVIELIEPTLLATRGPALVSVPVGIGKRAIYGRVKSRDAVSLLTVNGQRQPVDPAGLFQLDVPLTEPTTGVQIVAIDRQGRRGALDFQIHREAPVTTSAAEAAPPPPLRLDVGPQYALLIGNARYTGDLPALRTPRADVEEVGRILRERYGFHVIILHDATRYQMLSALNALRTRLTAKDDLLVYYAGHGHKVSVDGRQRGYWLPVDAEAGNPANWISTLDITDMLASMEVHKVLLISDSCYSGLLTRGLVRLVDTASDQARAAYLKTMLAQKSRNVLTSGSDLPVLDGGGGIYSIFAKSLARILLDARGPLQGQDVARSLQQMVTLTAQSMNFDQQPQYGPLQLAGHEGGDYILMPKL